MIRVKWILSPANQNIIGKKFPEVSKSRSRGEILQQCTILYPINQMWYVFKVIYYIYPLSDMTKILIQGKTTTVMMTSVQFFYTMGTCVTLPSLIIQISAEITLQKVEICYYPISTLVVQNTWYNQEKHKLQQIL